MFQKPYFILFILLQTGLASINAQHIDIDKKALSFMASEETMNIEFSYNELMIDNDVPEVEFLQKMHSKIIKHSDLEEAKQWATDYKEFKKTIWAASFTELLNERLGKLKNAPVFNQNDKTTKYTMKVNIPWMYFGYDAGIIDEPAKVTMDLDFYETANPTEILFSTQIRRAMGKYNKEDGDGETVGPSLNRMLKAMQFGAFKLSQALKRVVD